MGFFDRLRSKQSTASAPNDSSSAPPPPVVTVSANLYSGTHDLEVVGESNYQEALWSLCSSAPGDEVRQPVVAVLVPQPENPYDPNAIAVQVEARLVGYLSRSDAALYGPGIRALMERTGAYVALEGVVVGGGYYEDGPGRLGVWLEHDPSDFGIEVRTSRSDAPARRAGGVSGAMRTGFTEAWLTDVEDDSYDLSWYNSLPDGDRAAIAMLRDLLAREGDPIDRHFQFAELETRLYRCRDLYETALVEFDEACRLHDAEMGEICPAFLAKWGKIPLLETYRQMAIRQSKDKDWQACLWWSERGLALYGNAAAREDAVEDLLKRRNRALAKIDAATKPRARQPASRQVSVGAADPTIDSSPTVEAESSNIEILVCAECNQPFERIRVRGRKPRLCPSCRTH